MTLNNDLSGLRVVVVHAHPDDEAITTGGVLHHLATRGADVTVVTWGAMVPEVQKAVAEIDDLSIEVIDLRTISPMDRETIVASVEKTGRILVVHEAAKSFGAGAEIIAVVNEKAFLSLEARPMRLTGFDTIFPLARGEKHYLPTPERIQAKIRELADY